MARLETQFSRIQGLELLEQLKTGELDYDELEKKAATSKKKARKLRQVKALLLFVKARGSDVLESMLNNPDYDIFAIDEEGRLLVKRMKGKGFYARFNPIRI